MYLLYITEETVHKHKLTFWYMFSVLPVIDNIFFNMKAKLLWTWLMSTASPINFCTSICDMLLEMIHISDFH